MLIGTQGTGRVEAEPVGAQHRDVERERIAELRERAKKCGRLASPLVAVLDSLERAHDLRWSATDTTVEAFRRATAVFSIRGEDPSESMLRHITASLREKVGAAFSQKAEAAASACITSMGAATEAMARAEYDARKPNALVLGRIDAAQIAQIQNARTTLDALPFPKLVELYTDALRFNDEFAQHCLETQEARAREFTTGGGSQREASLGKSDTTIETARNAAGLLLSLIERTQRERLPPELMEARLLIGECKGAFRRILGMDVRRDTGHMNGSEFHRRYYNYNGGKSFTDDLEVAPNWIARSVQDDGRVTLQGWSPRADGKASFKLEL